MILMKAKTLLQEFLFTTRKRRFRIAVEAVLLVTLATGLLPPGGNVSAIAAERQPYEDLHSSPEPLRIPYEFVDGLIVCILKSSRGKLRLIFDTGANATFLPGKSKPIELQLGSRRIRLVPSVLRTPILDQVNTTLPLSKQIDGVLGQDVMCQFTRVTIDYKHLQIELEP
jgi:hypothetical protein